MDYWTGTISEGWQNISNIYTKTNLGGAALSFDVYTLKAAEQCVLVCLISGLLSLVWTPSQIGQIGQNGQIGLTLSQIDLIGQLGTDPLSDCLTQSYQCRNFDSDCS